MITERATELSGDLREPVERARAALDDGRIADLVLGLTAIPSPTGEERPLAEWVVGHLSDAGVEASLDVVHGQQANAVGRLSGTGGGARLMLYGPLDTAFAGAAAEDRPFLGDAPRSDFGLPPRREGGKVIGLGAENPKAFAGAGIAAIEAVAAAGLPLRGDVAIVLASGSMPVDGRPGIDRPIVGHGTGIRHYLDRGPRPDFAIVLKPGYAVAHEEVGLAWFRIVVRGAVNYTGIRHKGPYRNPVVLAARVVTALEAWFAEFTAANSDGLVAPQGSINAIRAGSPDRAAFVPATCELDLDLRVSPRSSPEAVRAELAAALDRLAAADPELELELQPRSALPGTATDPESWIVRSLIRAWEEREGRAHQPLGRASGASDAAVIRPYGIATARIGLPPPETPSPYPGFSMGVADVAATRRLAEVLVQAIIDTASRPRAELGLR